MLPKNLDSPAAASTNCSVNTCAPFRLGALTPGLQEFLAETTVRIGPWRSMTCLENCFLPSHLPPTAQRPVNCFDDSISKPTAPVSVAGRSKPIGSGHTLQD